MIHPVLANDELLEDIRRPLEAGALRVWWLGQSGFLVRHQAQENPTFLLIDPYLSDSLTRKYAATDKPHVRMTELAISPGRLDGIGIVTSSHNHTDHLDGETLKPLMSANPDLKIVVPAANCEFAADRLGVPPDRFDSLDDGGTLQLDGVLIHGVPAAHETIERDELGRCHFMGYVFELGNYTIYHSGDTLRYDEQAERLRNWDIDLALLPINGRAPERRVAGNLNGEEAAILAHDIRARCVVPCHYEMFEFNTASTELFERTCRSIGQSFEIMKCGGSLTLNEEAHAD